MPLTFDDPSIVFNVTTGTILEASAGSGKTTILTERWIASFLYLLIWEKKSVSEAFHSIVALTFTKKAATEMKIRIRSRLLDLWDSGELDYFLDQMKEYIAEFPLPKDQIKNHLLSIRDEIDDLTPSLSVTTISAFVLEVLHSNSLELSFDIGNPEDQGYDASIAEQESQTLLLQRLLSHYYEKHPAQKSFELGVSLCGFNLWNKLFIQLRHIIANFGDTAITKSLENSSYLLWKNQMISASLSDDPKQKVWDLLNNKCFDLINVLDCERNYSKGKLTSENEKF
ncbi:MAG: UvrD-helicase domain-containing protein, partial [Brevinema sp.]